MTPRSIRRAAERRARKLARKAEKNFAAAASASVPVAEPFTEPELLSEEPCLDPELFEEIERPSISEAQLLANRANAQLSTGPSSPEGRAKSSLNALKTGLTGRTVLLSSDEAAEYERHCAAYERELKPIGQQESDLAQSIADTVWRLRRIPTLEAALYAQGRIDFAEHDPELRPGMVELHTFMKYEKQFRNLHLQEARLARRRERELAELRQLQHERKENNLRQLDRAMGAYVAAQEAGQPFDPQENGFEFSIGEIRRHMFDCGTASFEQYAHKERSARRQAA